MDFEWDEAKNAANVRKHGIEFERAVEIFEGSVLTFNDERFDYGELRQLSIGRLADMLIATVVHTDRNGRRRIISARPASMKERKLYAPPV